MDNDEFIEIVSQKFIEDEENTKDERLVRFKELNTIFGPQGDQLLEGGTQASLALHEAANSYVSGNFMAVVLLVQAFIEHSLSGRFVMSGQEKLAESSFKKIIDAANEQSIIEPELHEKLDVLRKIRNPYVHARVGFKNGSLEKRMMDSKCFDSIEMAKLDALESLRILKEFKGKHVFMWFPSNET